MIERINKWLKGFQRYLFFYRDGFFELPYLSNSPQLMVESLISMPVTRHNPLEQAIYASNPFTKGVMRYREIEEGLWLLVTDITFKANIRTRALHDDEPCDYYFLSFSLYKSEVLIQQSTSINKIDLPSMSWSLYRPGTEIDAYHYKNTTGLFFNFVFSKDWIEKNFLFDSSPEANYFKKLLEAEAGMIFWDNIIPEAEDLTREIWSNMEKEKEGHFNTIKLKIRTLHIINEFFKNVFHKRLAETQTLVSTSERRSITSAEKILRDNLTANFPGIDAIAKKVNLSPTKLKMIFKSVYGTSLLQYYNEKRMIMAMELLKNSDMPIKTIAIYTGYNSPGKFSATFRKQFGILPSEIRSHSV